MSDKSRLLELANAIQVQVSEIQRYLVDTEQSDPSFDGQAKAVDFEGVDDTRKAALGDLTELKDLLTTPSELLRSYTPTDLVSRHAIDRFKIIQNVPVEGATAYEELAWATMLPVKTLRRVLRHAMSQRIFCEPEPGIIAHTQASRLLAENSKMRDYFGTVCQEAWPAATRVCDAIEKWPGSKEGNESGYQLAHGRTIYETLAQDPIKQARYDNAMAAYSGDRDSLKHMISNYDWAALGEATIVDVGGGIGTISRFLAKAFPHLNFVVEDRPDVLVNAAVEDPEINDRIRFLPHNFFEEQPVKDADLYFIRRVLMEWTDEKAIEIIEALKPALKVGAVVLIQDPYMPDPGSCSILEARKVRNSDMLAFAVASSSSRELEDWRGLFERAGPGFDFMGVRAVPNSDFAFIEAVWRGVEQ